MDSVMIQKFMWLFLKNSFLSVVEDRNDKNNLLVRSRIKGDIEKIFSDAEILQIPNSDYKFRSFIPRYKVIEKIKEELENINYPNFKNEVGKHDLERASNYSKIWQIMYNFQNKRNP